jgi:hypothetical protein
MANPLPKTTFYNLVVMQYNYNATDLQKIAEMAGVSEDIINRMFTSVAIKREDAKKLLQAFSEYTQDKWSLDNVKIALFPTFADLHTLHQFDLNVLSTGSGVEYTVIDMMLANHPVPEAAARLVLQTASHLSGQHYTLDNVDVKLIEEGER